MKKFSIYFLTMCLLCSCVQMRAMDINAQDENGRSVLMAVVSEGNVSDVAMLIGAGADVHHLDVHGYTVFDYALAGIAARQFENSKVRVKQKETSELSKNSKETIICLGHFLGMSEEEATGKLVEFLDGLKNSKLPTWFGKHE